MSKKVVNRKDKGKKKVTERLPIPYHAGQLIDDSIMGLTEAQNLVHKMLSNHLGRNEHYRMLGLVLHEITKGKEALKNIER